MTAALEATGRRARVEELLGADAVRARLAGLGAGAASQVLVLAPEDGEPGPAEPAAPAEPGDPDGLPVEELLLRGVELRVLLVDTARRRPAALEYARRLTELGGQVRTVPALPLRMVVLDRETAVLPLDPARTDTATVLHGRGPVAALCALFEGLWHGAAPLRHPRGRDRNGMAAQHYALLRILQQGDTDVVAARKLGISERTVRRLTAEALEVLGARSRFQAGARAAERGWLR
ncbi:hypothetical protein [Kitasatospora cineracea]|uniref:HTH luxR-type domain-containing protein n=1 Tax=Kitasatospora cineracea TaxID=88074 RepID=A0A8G1UCG1_9ACTN|nr:hypothetical protein [Kitasatospora cineracea]ROR38195.1 hypothetical protein EDD39_6372 [Kitasatospora cineracea]